METYKLLKYLYYLLLLLELEYKNTLYYEKYLNELLIYGFQHNMDLTYLKTLNKEESQQALKYLIKRVLKSL